MHDVEGNEFCLDWVAANVNMPSDPRHHRSTWPDRAEVLMVVGIDGVQPHRRPSRIEATLDSLSRERCAGGIAPLLHDTAPDRTT